MRSRSRRRRRSFNSRLREEATFTLLHAMSHAVVSTHASVRRRRAEAGFGFEFVVFQLTPP